MMAPATRLMISGMEPLTETAPPDTVSIPCMIPVTPMTNTEIPQTVIIIFFIWSENSFPKVSAAAPPATIPDISMSVPIPGMARLLWCFS